MDIFSHNPAGGIILSSLSFNGNLNSSAASSRSTEIFSHTDAGGAIS
jgi:hypothetical protein